MAACHDYQDTMENSGRAHMSITQKVQHLASELRSASPIRSTNFEVRSLGGQALVDMNCIGGADPPEEFPGMWPKKHTIKMPLGGLITPARSPIRFFTQCEDAHEINKSVLRVYPKPGRRSEEARRNRVCFVE